MKKVKTKPVSDPKRRELLAAKSRELPKSLRPLEKKLLSMGGSFAIVRPNETDAGRILAQGVRLSGRSAELVRLDMCRCHGNSAKLHLADPSFRIMTGYALSSDSIWRQHTWTIRDGKVVETTEPRVLYFGFELAPGDESNRFAAGNLPMDEIERILKEFRPEFKPKGSSPRARRGGRRPGSGR